MNIVEAHIKFKGQLIVIISGFPGSGKTPIAQMIADDFKISHIDLEDYYNNSVKATLPNGDKVVNHFSDDAVDWDRFNSDVNSKKGSGVVISGFGFPSEKLKFRADQHIFLSISKKVGMERRKAQQEKQKKVNNMNSMNSSDNSPDSTETSKDETTSTGSTESVRDNDLLIMNKLIFPYYIQLKERSTVNKFVNLNSITPREGYDQVFDHLMKVIQRNLYNKDSRDHQTQNRHSPSPYRSRRQGRIPVTTDSISSGILNEAISLSSSMLGEPSEDEPEYETETTIVTIGSDDSDSSSTSASSPPAGTWYLDADKHGLGRGVYRY